MILGLILGFTGGVLIGALVALMWASNEFDKTQDPFQHD